MLFFFRWAKCSIVRKKSTDKKNYGKLSKPSWKQLGFFYAYNIIFSAHSYCHAFFFIIILHRWLRYLTEWKYFPFRPMLSLPCQRKRQKKIIGGFKDAKAVYSITKAGRNKNKMTGIGIITKEDLIIAYLSQKGKPYVRVFEDCIKHYHHSSTTKTNSKHVLEIREVEYELKRR